MKIIVLLNKTQQLETSITPKTKNQANNHKKKEPIVNPHDEYVIKQALEIKEKTKAELTIMNVGPCSYHTHFINTLPQDTDNGVRIHNHNLEAEDPLAIAKNLAKNLTNENANLILCSRQSNNDDNQYISTMVAVLMGWPHVNLVTKINVTGDLATIERKINNHQSHIYKINLPVLVGI